MKEEHLVLKETKNIDVFKQQINELKKQSVLKEKLELLVPNYVKNKNGLRNILLSIKETENLPLAKDKIKTVYEMIDTKLKVNELIVKYQKVKKSIQQEELIIKQQSEILEEAINAYNDELIISKACPTCFAPITEETTQRILTKFKGGN